MEGLGPPKTLQNQWFFKVFGVVGFPYFGALDGHLGVILAPLGPIWSQNGSQNGCPNGSKSTQDGLLGAQEAQAQPAGAILKAVTFKMAPRWLKMASSSPR